MTKPIPILVTTLLVLSRSSMAAEDPIPLQTAAPRLVGALWTPMWDTIEVVVHEKSQRTPQPKDKIEETVRNIYRTADDIDKMVVSKEDFDAEVQQEVERIVAEERRPMYYKKRVLLSGRNQRMDFTAIRKPLDADGPFRETQIMAYDEEGSFIGSYKVDHVEKAGSLVRGRWKREHFADLGSFSTGSRALLKGTLGKVDRTPDGRMVVVPDQARIAACIAGEPDAARITVMAGTDREGRKVHNLTVYLPKQAHPIGRWAIDAGDYNVCYREELINPATGSLMVVREAEAFAPVEGTNRLYPRHATFKQFSPKDGSVKRSVVTTVESVSRAEVDPESFAFSVPEDYAVVEFRFGKPVVIQPMRGGLTALAAKKLDKTEIPKDTPKPDAVVEAPPSRPDAEQEQTSAPPVKQESDELPEPVESNGTTSVILLALAAVLVCGVVIRSRLSSRGKSGS